MVEVPTIFVDEHITNIPTLQFDYFLLQNSFDFEFLLASHVLLYQVNYGFGGHGTFIKNLTKHFTKCILIFLSLLDIIIVLM